MAGGGGGILEEPLILHRILSFLTTREAARTSVLAKAWLEAWRTRPYLEFDDAQHIFCSANKRPPGNLSYDARVRAQQRFIIKFSRAFQLQQELSPRPGIFASSLNGEDRKQKV